MQLKKITWLENETATIIGTMLNPDYIIIIMVARQPKNLFNTAQGLLGALGIGPSNPEEENQATFLYIQITKGKIMLYF